VKMAFKVFSNWDEAWDQQKAQLLVLPWGHLLQLCNGPDNNSHLQGLLQVQPDKQSKTLPFTSPAARTLSTMWPEWTLEGWLPFCLYKVGQSPTPTLNRVKSSQTSWTWWQKTDVALGPRPPSRSPWRSPG
jgi:hypothetical protein